MRVVTIPLLAALLLGLGIGMAAQDADRFDHQQHEGLFPRCLSCHQGIEAGTPESSFPPAEACARCHDGDRLRTVRWTGPRSHPSNLKFDHRTHFAATEGSTDRPSSRAAETAVGVGPDEACGQCHLRQTPEGEPVIRRPGARACMSCHAHEAESHTAPGRDCSVCHLPLTEAVDLPQAAIEGFRSPRTHDAEDFLLSHAPADAVDGTACATCHARESCTRCHMNGGDVGAIRELSPDPRMEAIQAGREPAYPTPGTHDSGAWDWNHGLAAPSAACGNCHAQSSCRSCHRDGTLPAIDSLPRLAQEDPRGVRLLDGGHWVHQAGFVQEHPLVASVETQSCAGCHAVSYCESCHDAADQPVFHWGNYLQTHATEAWGNEVQCTACHNPEVFCRGCHQNLGLATDGRVDVAYHTSRPLWLLGHGAAARQSLESCRSCHSQNDCTRCHSGVGGWRINPHGPGFDPDRAGEANPAACLPCHRVGGGPR